MKVLIQEIHNCPECRYSEEVPQKTCMYCQKLEKYFMPNQGILIGCPLPDYKEEEEEFCQWQINKHNKELYTCGCIDSTFFRDSGFNFCPNCGKRIKEVG